MCMDRQAIAYIAEDLATTQLHDVEGLGIYSDKPLHRVCEPVAAAITLTTLTGLVDYIKSGIDKQSLRSKLLVHVVSPNKVRLESELNADRKREVYLSCEALTPDNIVFDRFIGAEEFNIMLQSSFVDTEDKAALLCVTGCIQEKNVKDIGDDGVSQSVTMKTGVASVNEVKVPNPVTLAPYRTFPEIEQPTSKFIFRMQSGPVAALYEADGGAWRNVAMAGIKAFLTEKLTFTDNVEIIA